MNLFKRITAGLLACLMLLAYVPQPAHATEYPGTEPTVGTEPTENVSPEAPDTTEPESPDSADSIVAQNLTVDELMTLDLTPAQFALFEEVFSTLPETDFGSLEAFAAQWPELSAETRANALEAMLSADPFAASRFEAALRNAAENGITVAPDVSVLKAQDQQLVADVATALQRSYYLNPNAGSAWVVLTPDGTYADSSNGFRAMEAVYGANWASNALCYLKWDETDSGMLGAAANSGSALLESSFLQGSTHNELLQNVSNLTSAAAGLLSNHNPQTAYSGMVDNFSGGDETAFDALCNQYGIAVEGESGSKAFGADVTSTQLSNLMVIAAAKEFVNSQNNGTEPTGAANLALMYAAYTAAVNSPTATQADKDNYAAMNAALQNAISIVHVHAALDNFMLCSSTLLDTWGTSDQAVTDIEAIVALMCAADTAASRLTADDLNDPNLFTTGKAADDFKTYISAAQAFPEMGDIPANSIALFLNVDSGTPVISCSNAEAFISDQPFDPDTLPLEYIKYLDHLQVVNAADALKEYAATYPDSGNAWVVLSPEGSYTSNSEIQIYNSSLLCTDWTDDGILSGAFSDGATVLESSYVQGSTMDELLYRVSDLSSAISNFIGNFSNPQTVYSGLSSCFAYNQEEFDALCAQHGIEIYNVSSATGSGKQFADNVTTTQLANLMVIAAAKLIAESGGNGGELPAGADMAYRYAIYTAAVNSPYASEADLAAYDEMNSAFHAVTSMTEVQEVFDQFESNASMLMESYMNDGQYEKDHNALIPLMQEVGNVAEDISADDLKAADLYISDLASNYFNAYVSAAEAKAEMGEIPSNAIVLFLDIQDGEFKTYCSNYEAYTQWTEAPEINIPQLPISTPPTITEEVTLPEDVYPVLDDILASDIGSAMASWDGTGSAWVSLTTDGAAADTNGAAIMQGLYGSDWTNMHLYRSAQGINPLVSLAIQQGELATDVANSSYTTGNSSNALMENVANMTGIFSNVATGASEYQIFSLMAGNCCGSEAAMIALCQEYGLAVVSDSNGNRFASSVTNTQISNLMVIAGCRNLLDGITGNSQPTLAAEMILMYASYTGAVYSPLGTPESLAAYNTMNSRIRSATTINAVTAALENFETSQATLLSNYSNSATAENDGIALIALMEAADKAARNLTAIDLKDANLYSTGAASQCMSDYLAAVNSAAGIGVAYPDGIPEGTALIFLGSNTIGCSASDLDVRGTLKTEMQKLLPIFTADTESMDLAEQIICTDDILEQHYIHYLEVAVGQRTAATFPYLNTAAMDSDLADNQFDTANEDLNEKLYILFFEAQYITIKLQDSYGDGWNGCKLNVYANKNLITTATISSGSGHTVTVPYETGKGYVFEWIKGNWPGECSFTILLDDIQLFSASKTDCGNYTSNKIVFIYCNHNWQAATCSVPQTCALCGTMNGNTLPHTEVIDEAVAPTCTESGLTEGKHCEVCGKVLVAQEELAPAHTEVIDEAVAPTCTESGLTEGKHCETCGEVLVAQEEIAPAHTEVILPGKEATCTTPGLTQGKYCSVCEEVLIVQEETAAAHIFVSNVCKYCRMRKGICGNDLTWTLTAEGVLTISGTGAMNTTSNHAVPWYDYRYSITQLIIQPGVTTIGSNAFYNYNSLTSISLPDSLTSIGSHAFYDCDSLTSITLPDSITAIGSYAFCDCDSLTSITLPDSLTTIGDSVFRHCDSLTSITFSDSLTSIGNSAFSSCTNLENVTFPDSLTSIGSAAFYYCVALKAVTFEGSAPTLNYDSFLFITATVYYPGEDTTWTDDVKQNCGGNLTWVAINNCEHTWTDATCTDPKTCSKCGSTEGTALGHSYNSEVTTAPTCTAPGVTTYTCTNCGYVFISYNVTALGHTEVIDAAVEATCTESGLTEGKHCEACGEILIAQVPVSATGHSWDQGIVTIPSSCEEDGERIFICSCGAGRTEVIPARGHSWDHGIITVAPSCEEDGERIFICSCGAGRTEVIPARGHSWDQGIVTVEPSCEKDGELIYICSCGEGKTEVLTSLGHIEVIDEAYSPTCTKSGATEGKHCDTCGKVLIAQTLIPATGDHHYENGICIGCSDYTPAEDSDDDGIYEITNAGQMFWFGQMVMNQQQVRLNVKLVNDITFNTDLLNSIAASGEAPEGLLAWVPISGYQGIFDGDGHTIYGLYYNNSSSYVGLFTVLSGTVKNVNIADSYISASRYVGGFAGQNSGTIENCTFDGVINAAHDASYVGGIAGYNESSINGCTNYGTVTGSQYTGGIAGENTRDGSIYVSHNTGTISGTTHVGGIAGENSNSAQNSLTKAVILDCCNSGTVSGTGYVCGITGWNYTYGKIVNCYNSGTISGNSNIGHAIADCNYGTITDCYYLSFGENDSISGTTWKSAASFASGEVAYLLNGSTDEGDLVWKQDLGTDAYPSFTGSTVYRIQTGGCTTNATFVYSNEGDAEDQIVHTWGEPDVQAPTCSNPGYTGYTCEVCGESYSDTEIPATGVHTYDNGICTGCSDYMAAEDENDDAIYEISNAGQLLWFAERVNVDQQINMNAELLCDITLNENLLDSGVASGTTVSGLLSWTPIKNYKGTFNGNGYSISGLYYSTTSVYYVGLFSRLYGTVENVTVLDSYIKCADSAGGIVGDNYGTIRNCSYSGIITGNSGSLYVGGIAGYNREDVGVIDNCTVNGTVSGNQYTGGIAGYNGHYISNCTNNATVTGISKVGGITGSNNRSIAYCTNTGTINGSREYTGGIAGYNGNLIKQCSNEGTIKGYDCTGGIAGKNYSSSLMTFILQCSNTGNVTGRTFVGGIVGHVDYASSSNYSTVSRCYNTGAISGNGYVSGIAGYNTKYSQVNGCYNSGSVSGNNNAGNAVVDVNEGTVTGCYYLGYGENDNLDGTTWKSAKKFSSGEVAYLLNGGASDENVVWRQNIGTDAYPSFEGGIVYKNQTGGCTTNATYSYANKELPPLISHTWDEGTVTQEPTCTADGVMTYTCTITDCDGTKEEAIVATGHSYETVVTAPTCTEKGYTTYTCACGDTYTADEVAALGHNYVDGVCGNCGEAEPVVGYSITGIIRSFGSETAPITVKLFAVGAEEVSYEVTVTGNEASYTISGIEAGEYTMKVYKSAHMDSSIAVSVNGETTQDVALTLGSGTTPFKLASINLSLADNVNIKYGAQVPAGFTDVYMIFNMNGKDTIVREYTINAKGRYVFEFAGVNPQCMGDNVCATVYAICDGTEVSYTYAEYSVRKYCEGQLNKTIDAKLRCLLSDLLIYGEKAQFYKNYKTDQLVTADLESVMTPSAFTELDNSYNLQSTSGEKSEVADWSGVSLSLASEVRIKLTIKTSDPSAFVYTVTVDGTTTKYTEDDLEPDGTDANKYYLYVKGVPATRFGLPVIAKILQQDGTQIGRTFTYSVFTYIQKNQNSNDTKLAEMLKAIYNYGVSAQNYN